MDNDKISNSSTIDFSAMDQIFHGIQYFPIGHFAEYLLHEGGDAILHIIAAHPWYDDATIITNIRFALEKFSNVKILISNFQHQTISERNKIQIAILQKKVKHIKKLILEISKELHINPDRLEILLSSDLVNMPKFQNYEKIYFEIMNDTNSSHLYDLIEQLSADLRAMMYMGAIKDLDISLSKEIIIFLFLYELLQIHNYVCIDSYELHKYVSDLIIIKNLIIMEDSNIVPILDIGFVLLHHNRDTNLSDFLNALGIGIYLSDISHNILFYNKYLSDVLSNKNHLKGFKWNLDQEEDDTKKDKISFERSVKIDHLERNFISTEIKISNKKDDTIRRLGVVTDITKFKEIIDEKDTFITFLSHETNTPLKTSIENIKQLSSSIRNDKYDKQESLSILRKIESSLVKISNTGRNLYQLTALNNNTLIDKTVSNMVDIITSIIEDEFPLKIREQIQFDIDQGEMLVECNINYIRHVLLNLINNGIKYGSDNLIIQINAIIKHSRDFIEIDIIDHGAGIPQNEIKNIFQKSYRINPEKSKGLGIGLFLCKEIILLHEGYIHVTNHKKFGAQFTFGIPVGDISDDLVPTDKIIWDSVHILFIEDDDDYYTTIVNNIFNKLNISCDRAMDIEDAIVALVSNDYDLILIDYHLLTVTAGDVIRRIKSDTNQWLSIKNKIIIQSGAIIDDPDCNSLPYVSKPCFKESFIQMINLTLKKQKRQ